MLVLTRKVDQEIFIGEDIRIVVVDIQERQVKVGISCPDAIPVMRSELGTRTKKNKWPNLSPDEISCLMAQHKELSEWWTKPHSTDRRRERTDLQSFIQDLERWALHEFLERYSRWYQGTKHGGNN
jgi:carbon storage regulator CsrA